MLLACLFALKNGRELSWFLHGLGIISLFLTVSKTALLLLPLLYLRPYFCRLYLGGLIASVSTLVFLDFELLVFSFVDRDSAIGAVASLHIPSILHHFYGFSSGFSYFWEPVGIGFAGTGSLVNTDGYMIGAESWFGMALASLGGLIFFSLLISGIALLIRKYKAGGVFVALILLVVGIYNEGMGRPYILVSIMLLFMLNFSKPSLELRRRD